MIGWTLTDNEWVQQVGKDIILMQCTHKTYNVSKKIVFWLTKQPRYHTIII